MKDGGAAPVNRAARLALHRAGKPVRNAFVESFKSRLHDEWLNEHIFLSLAEAR
jgi:Integrase core domain